MSDLLGLVQLFVDLLQLLRVPVSHVLHLCIVSPCSILQLLLQLRHFHLSFLPQLLRCSCCVHRVFELTLQRFQLLMNMTKPLLTLQLTSVLRAFQTLNNRIE